MLIPHYKVLKLRNLCLFRATKSLNRGINVNSSLQSAITAELMFIPIYKVLKPRN